MMMKQCIHSSIYHVKPLEASADQTSFFKEEWWS